MYIGERVVTTKEYVCPDTGHVLWKGSSVIMETEPDLFGMVEVSHPSMFGTFLIVIPVSILK